MPGSVRLSFNLLRYNLPASAVSLAVTSKISPMSEFFKWLDHLKLSRSVVVAAWVATIAYLASRRFTPDLITPIPKEWEWLPPTLGIFLTVIVVPWAWTAVAQPVKRARDQRRARNAFLNAPLPGDQEELLYALILQGEGSAHYIKAAHHAGSALNRGDLRAAANGLSVLGLIRLDDHQPAHVFLTPIGKHRGASILKKYSALEAAELKRGDTVRHIQTGREMTVTGKVKTEEPTRFGAPVVCEWKDEADGKMVGGFAQDTLERIYTA